MPDQKNTADALYLQLSMNVDISPRPMMSVDISPKKLAYLEMGLFCSLSKRGTSRERICQAMNLSPEEYAYLCKLR